MKAGLKVAENVQGIDQRDMLIRDDKMRKQGMRSSAACAPDAKDTDNDERIDLSDIKAPGVIRVTMKAATMRAMGTRELVKGDRTKKRIIFILIKMMNGIGIRDKT